MQEAPEMPDAAMLKRLAEEPVIGISTKMMLFFGMSWI